MQKNFIFLNVLNFMIIFLVFACIQKLYAQDYTARHFFNKIKASQIASYKRNRVKTIKIYSQKKQASSVLDRIIHVNNKGLITKIEDKSEEETDISLHQYNALGLLKKFILTNATGEVMHSQEFRYRNKLLTSR